jgi:hypothetical protein
MALPREFIIILSHKGPPKLFFFTENTIRTILIYLDFKSAPVTPKGNKQSQGLKI